MSKPIDKKTFDKMRKAYDDKHPGKTRSVMFTAASVTELMKTPGSANLKIYFGETEDGKDTVMLVPADAEGQDLFATIMDEGQLCPPYCPK